MPAAKEPAGGRPSKLYQACLQASRILIKITQRTDTSSLALATTAIPNKTNSKDLRSWVKCHIRAFKILSYSLAIVFLPYLLHSLTYSDHLQSSHTQRLTFESDFNTVSLSIELHRVFCNLYYCLWFLLHYSSRDHSLTSLSYTDTSL